ncbi:MAG: hypothetical protein EXR93_05610 [Gemmatimonadetes bacterium]|nr:hypothetical protein [Gemmatimonadota bacterium]
MLTLIAFTLAGVTAIWGHVQSRRFVRSRLRFVDGVQNPIVPVVAGVCAVVLAAPVVWLLPIVGGGTALLFGLGVGTGVLAGQRETKSLPGG